MEYSLRAATRADYDFLKLLHHTTLREYITRLWGWDEHLQDQLFDREFNPAVTKIITVGDTDMGSLAVERVDDSLFISCLLILPEYQRKGIGSAIVEDVIRQAADQGLPVTLNVLKPNPAKKLYDSLGFVVTKESKERYYMKFEHPNG